jgi:hypothetical protein
VNIVAQLEHDQLTPSGLMVHDHHPAAPAPPTRLMASTRPTAEVLPGVATVWDGLVEAAGDLHAAYGWHMRARRWSPATWQAHSPQRPLHGRCRYEKFRYVVDAGGNAARINTRVATAPRSGAWWRATRERMNFIRSGV